ncbi:MAG: hypothetical protein JSV76_06620 [Candidatus Bathyarchaeota archaeon]|nr:MAG: hypothetical protein JSV76_06620 [Candidatus Bathyarchaeota archaeon]
MVKRKKWFEDLPDVAKDIDRAIELTFGRSKEFQRWLVILGVASIVGVSGMLITYQTFNPWVKWLEGWVRNHEDRMLMVEGQNNDLQNRLLQLEQADLNGEISVTYLENTSGIDAHIVEGFLINYGTETALNVRIDLIWTLSGTDVETRTIYVGTMTGRSVVTLNSTFFFEDDGPNQYQVSWT